MSVPDDFRDPGTLVVVTALGENPLAGSVFEKQAIHEGDQQWQDDHQAILQRVNSATGSVRLVDAEELPTFFTSIRLAPLTILVALAFGIYGPIQTELLKLRICEVKLNISEEICQHISDIQYKELANSVVKETAEFQLYSNLISSLPPILFSLFVGSWSDAYGRKAPMVLSLIGMCASAIYVSVIASYKLHPAYLLIAPALASLTGGWSILLMGMFSFIGDYTTDKNRGTNIAVVDGLLGLFGNIGSLAGGYVYKFFGMAVPFYLTVGCFVATLLHTTLFLHDRLRRTTGRISGREYSTLFSLNNFLDSFRMLRRERVGNTRGHIFLLLACLLLITAVTIGDSNVTQLLVEFQPFNWSVTYYTVFSCVSGLLSSISMIAGMILLRQYLGMPDTLIGVFAVLSAIMYYFGFGVAQVDWVLYVAVVAGLFRNIMVPCLRSLLSGLVDRDEIGKIMSFISSCQSVTPLFASVIFTSMFAATSSWWPGLCFVVGAFVLVPVMATFAYVDVVRRCEIYAKDPSLLRPDSQQSD